MAAILRKRQLTPILAAVALAALVGCSRDDGASAQGGAAVPPSSPESYMKDGAFRSKLSEQTAKRGELASARGAIVAQMTEMIEAKRKALGIAGAPGSALSPGDEAKLKAELEKDPAWNELYKRCQDANAAIAENRRDTMAAVRERLTRPAAGSRPSNVKQGNLK